MPKMPLLPFLPFTAPTRATVARIPPTTAMINEMLLMMGMNEPRMAMIPRTSPAIARPDVGFLVVSVLVPLAVSDMELPSSKWQVSP